MCGINGIYFSKEINNIKNRMLKMNESISHRGPNQSDLSLNDFSALGHVRLSILDLSSNGIQPMTSNNGRYTIVFNGEIYNYNEIKSMLNYDFKSQTDSEVICASIEINGLDWFLERANGMFAIGLIDSELKTLTLVRDRFGIKPLYYCITNNSVIFSSEIKGILNSGLVDAKLDLSSIDDYLGYRYVREPFTFFEGIRQVESATYLNINRDLTISKVKYYSLAELNFDKDYNEEKLIKEVENKLKKAVNYRTIADVKVGAFLSGGVDSSLIASLSAGKTNMMNTYTIGYKDKEYNEFEYSQLVANQLNVKHNMIETNFDDYDKYFETLISYKDAPLGVPNEIPLAIMSNVLSKDITVVLSGEGADELFGGYGRIYRSPFDYKNSEPKCSFYDYFIQKYEYVSRDERDSILNCKIDRRLYFDKLCDDILLNNSNEEFVFKFFYEYHIKGLLQRVDITSMQASVEARVPFLDHELVDYVFKNVPYELKLKWNSESSKSKATKLNSKDYSEVLDTPKYILKKVSEKYIPRDNIYRKKMGFPVPLNNWFDKLKHKCSSILKEQNWLNYKEFEKQILNDATKGQKLWMFLNIGIFVNMYFYKNWRY